MFHQVVEALASTPGVPAFHFELNPRALTAYLLLAS